MTTARMLPDWQPRPVYCPSVGGPRVRVSCNYGPWCTYPNNGCRSVPLTPDVACPTWLEPRYPSPIPLSHMPWIAANTMDWTADGKGLRQDQRAPFMMLPYNLAHPPPLDAVPCVCRKVTLP